MTPMQEIRQQQEKAVGIIKSQEGKVGYLVAWILGVPASLLFVIYLVFGGK